MKVTSPQSILSEAFATAARVIALRSAPGRPEHPVRLNLLIQSDSSQTLSVVGLDTNSRRQLVVTIPADVEVAGAVLVDAGLLTKLVSKMPEGDIALLEDGGDGLLMEASVGQYRLPMGDKVAFQEVSPPPFPDGVEEIEVPAEDLLAAIKKVGYACLHSDVSDNKVALTGVRFAVSQDGDTICRELIATDAHRLALSAIPLVGPEAQFTIPWNAISDLAYLLKNLSDTVKIAFDQSRVRFRLGKYELTVYFIDAQYPNVKGLIPKIEAYSTKLTFVKSQFVDALDRVAVMASQSQSIVDLVYDAQGSIELLGDAREIGKAMEAVPLVAHEGDPITISCNYVYLLEAVKTFEEQFQLCLGPSPTSLMLVTQEGGSHKSGLMPIDKKRR